MCLPLRGQFTLKRIRIRSAQLRGFASLSLLRLGQTARRQTLRHLPYAKNKKQPAKNAGASLRFAPSGVFCFLLRASGFGFGSGRFARSALVLSGARRCPCSFGVFIFGGFYVSFLCLVLFSGWFVRRGRARRVCFVGVGFLVSGLAFLFGSRSGAACSASALARGSRRLSGLFGRSSSRLSLLRSVARVSVARRSVPVLPFVGFCPSARSFLGGVFMSALVGFCGSRSLPSAFSPLVALCVSAVASAGRGVAVGCAAGADRFALSAARVAGASVSLFSASSFGVGRGSFARRSAALVSAVAASGGGCGLVAFVSSGCPVGLFPSASASRCFSGFGSGSWASVAFAVGRGVPVVVFPCVSSGVLASSVLPSAWSGSWVSAGSGVWSSGFRFVPSSSALPF